MIGRLNHVAIVVPDLEKAAGQYRDTLGARKGVILLFCGDYRTQKVE